MLHTSLAAVSIIPQSRKPPSSKNHGGPQLHYLHNNILTDDEIMASDIVTSWANVLVTTAAHPGVAGQSPLVAQPSLAPGPWLLAPLPVGRHPRASLVSPVAAPSAPVCLPPTVVPYPSRLVGPSSNLLQISLYRSTTTTLAEPRDLIIFLFIVNKHSERLTLSWQVAPHAHMYHPAMYMRRARQH